MRGSGCGGLEDLAEDWEQEEAKQQQLAAEEQQRLAAEEQQQLADSSEDLQREEDGQGEAGRGSGWHGDGEARGAGGLPGVCNLAMPVSWYYTIY